MSLLLCTGLSEHVYACTSKTTGHNRTCQESPAPHKNAVTAIYHHGVPRWHHYPIGAVAGTAYALSALARIPIYRSDETKDGHKPHVSCCPFCTYTIQNDLAYLNHIVGVHYNANFACGTCLSAVTSSGQQMKRHINECSGLAPPPMAFAGKCTVSIHPRRVPLAPNM